MRARPSVTIPTSESQSEVAAFMHGICGPSTRRIDTHAASIFLTADRAWKLKQAVRFGYLDFTTQQRRKAALEAEFALNRRTAPTLYIAVHPIARDSEGKLSIGGEGRPIDWVLEMRRFADDALLSEQAEAGNLDAAVLMRLAERLQQFHQQAQVVTWMDAAASFKKVIEDNAASMAAVADILGVKETSLLASGHQSLCDRLQGLLQARGREGRVRQGHGDLHLGNIAMIDGEPTPFDCLEFSEALAQVDVLYDLSFLLMDLWHKRLQHGANIVLNHYLDHSAIDEAGIELLPLFLSVRAAIRAHVLAAQSLRCGRNLQIAEQARGYLTFARTLLDPVQPRLIAIGGLSGSGKSTLARHIGHLLGRAPGARILRSDVIRKQLAGMAPEAHLPRKHYSAAASRQVYLRLTELAGDTIRQGSAVIVDAVFADEGERAAAESLAHAAGVAFDGIWLTAEESQRTARIQSRAPDASDADAEVAHTQSSYDVGPLGGWQQISAGGSIDEAVASAVGALRLSTTGTDSEPSNSVAEEQ